MFLSRRMSGTVMVSAILLFALAYIVFMCYYKHAHKNCAKIQSWGAGYGWLPFVRPGSHRGYYYAIKLDVESDHSKLLNVLYPAIPSTVSPWSRWYCRTAASNPLPKLPGHSTP